MIEVIVIGGSAGALEALGALLPPIKASKPIALVLHMLASRPSTLADVIAMRSPLKVRDAEDKELLLPDTIYLASPNYHLLVEPRGCLSLSADDPVHYSRPAIDVLFESAAFSYGAKAAGVLLSGASTDGAVGLARLKKAGGITIVQSPESAVERYMPDSALQVAPADYVLPPAKIGELLASWGNR